MLPFCYLGLAEAMEFLESDERNTTRIRNQFAHMEYCETDWLYSIIHVKTARNRSKGYEDARGVQKKQNSKQYHSLQL